MPALLNDMPLDRANRLFMHPVHQDAFRALVQLIVDLRACGSYEDWYHFQQELLAKVFRVAEHRTVCTRVAKRLRRSKAVPADAPELRSGADTNDPESWELEADVCKRVTRQFRSIGDALAWRVFNYDRRVIVAFSRNQPPGPIAGKKGLTAERAFLTQSWETEHCFVLLHDLTSCLRIGDATLFKTIGYEYEAYLYEIKTNPNKRNPGQLQRKRIAEEAIRDGGPLPGDPSAQLVKLNLPYKKNFKMLRNAFELTRERGVQGMKVQGDRALVAADLHRGYELWPEEVFLERTGAVYESTLKRAGIRDVGHHVTYRSDDMVARSPIFPPWAIYPLPPVMCANLIVDMAVYFVTISSEPLLDALRTAGLAAEWVLPSGMEKLGPSHVILRAHNGSRSIEMRPLEMQRLLLELVDLSTWVEGVKELLQRENIGLY